MTTLDMLLRLATGLGLGALIGIERPWRGPDGRAAHQRPSRHPIRAATGLRLYRHRDIKRHPRRPHRVAAQIVSGIGFLGAGVILRDGLRVRGLNTAATLWCSAAVGALAGAGMYPIAALDTAAVITANTALHPLAGFIASAGSL